MEKGLNLTTSLVTWPSLCLASYIADCRGALIGSRQMFRVVSAMTEDVALLFTVLDRCIAQIYDFQMLPDQQQNVQDTVSAVQFFKKLRLS